MANAIETSLWFMEDIEYPNENMVLDYDALTDFLIEFLDDELTSQSSW